MVFTRVIKFDVNLMRKLRDEGHFKNSMLAETEEDELDKIIKDVDVIQKDLKVVFKFTCFSLMTLFRTRFRMWRITCEVRQTCLCASCRYSLCVILTNLRQESFNITLTNITNRTTISIFEFVLRN